MLVPRQAASGLFGASWSLSCRADVEGHASNYFLRPSNMSPSAAEGRTAPRRACLRSEPASHHSLQGASLHTSARPPCSTRGPRPSQQNNANSSIYAGFFISALENPFKISRGQTINRGIIHSWSIISGFKLVIVIMRF